MEISIIIPLYNGTKFLQKLCSAIQAQSFKDFEAIFIDNGSTDKPETFFKNLNDNRFKLVSIPQRGVSNARNYGIKISQGKYIAFLDCDDLIEPDYLESLYYNIEKNKSDIVFCDFYVVTNKTKLPIKYTYKDIKNNHAKIVSDILLPLICPETTTPYFSAVWAKLIRKQSLHLDVRFPLDISIGEDYLFILKLFKCIKSISFVHKPLYLYIRNNFSVLNKYNKDNLVNTDKYLNYFLTATSELNLTKAMINYSLFEFRTYIFAMRNAALGNNYIEFKYFFEKFKTISLSKQNKKNLSFNQRCFKLFSSFLPQRIIFNLVKLFIK